MRIVLQLTPAAAECVRSRQAGTHDVLSWLDCTLTPIHRQTSDRALSAFFQLEVSDPEEARQLVSRLLADPSVDAAYIKPDDEAPVM